jgi:phage baseplate assembly protein V
MNRTGPFTAVVVNAIDPLALGRVQVQIPALGERLLPWARLLAPRAGDAQGIFFRPEVGDEVVVDFLNGDREQPVVLGGLWSAAGPPPTTLAEQATIRTRSGHTVVFDDAPGGECIEITSRGGRSILLSDEAGAGRIEISNGDATARLIIGDDGTITLSADGGDLVLRAGGEVVIAGSDVVIDGGNVRLSAAAQVDISGAAGISVDSAASVEIKGALVPLEGMVVVNGRPLP